MFVLDTEKTISTPSRDSPSTDPKSDLPDAIDLTDDRQWHTPTAGESPVMEPENSSNSTSNGKYILNNNYHK